MRWLRRALLALLLLLALAASAGWLALRGSLARIDGEAPLAGLAAPVALERDALGTLTLQAANRSDLARALGYAHAQERYFQMDLMRRNAAGELAELVGAAALPLDRRHRLHRFRARASAALAELPGAERALVDAYRDGVNAGLADLRVRPWEYLLLRSAPRAWSSEDTALVIYAMFLDLNSDGENRRELDLSRWAAVLPADLLRFLVQPGSEWDAPLHGDALAAATVPDPGALDLRRMDPQLLRPPGPTPATRTAGRWPLPAIPPEAALVGSNNFAVGGTLTADGAAIVADDMHLALRVPNLWFRARLRYTDAADPGTTIDLNGVTLPGTPALVAGSNGHIAWGFTNSYGDWLDFVRVQRDPDDAERYRVPGGWARLEHHRERLRVRCAPDEELDVVETRWGPITASDADGTPLALAWTAHAPRALNLGLLGLEHCRDAAAALALAPRIGMPVQNFVVGDSAGHIGWTLTGNAMPLRAGIDAQRPSDWSQPGTGWTGWLDAAGYPRLYDPPEARLWSANARTVDGEALALEGDGGYDLGARARQIRDGLRARARFTPADLLAVQLDDRALFLQRWQPLLLHTLDGSDEALLRDLRHVTATWSGSAGVDAVDYRVVRAFRQQVIDATLAPFVALAQRRDADFRLPSAQGYEAAVWTLLQTRPPHLLDPGYADWDALLRAAARRTAEELAAQPGGLAARRWGERNTAAIRHPLSRFLPAALARALDMPAQALPGDSNMPRVQAPEFGASERFAIVPGHEERSYLMMPGGQSGHPLSPFHGAGHADWVEGRPTPLLPGVARHRLQLLPAAPQREGNG